ncbi:hypothetical protein H5410_044388 [Solanum commersonii]|uniref:Uncharacterized protein n=1 Tax=Solanum commersonii TaxID=4109 RepID=A0A9J5X7X3_SOLCO|nr:hypothetical protein H5410_044388 [Solanum commersonii]
MTKPRGKSCGDVRRIEVEEEQNRVMKCKFCDAYMRQVQPKHENKFYNVVVRLKLLSDLIRNEVIRVRYKCPLWWIR